MRLHKEVFRAYDIRGLAGEQIHAELAYNLGLALGHFWQHHPQYNQLPRAVAVGYDARLSSPELSHAMMEGLSTAGFRVLSLGLSPTPLVYYATIQPETPFGVVITGSHNPAEYNGFKMGAVGGTLTSEDIQGLYHRLLHFWKPFSHSGRMFERSLAFKQYIQYMIDQFHQLRTKQPKPLTIVIDSGNGAGGPIAAQLYRLTGHRIISLYEQPDGRFPHHHPDPSEEKNLVALRERVLSEKADFGIAFDGDADRIGLIDQDGSIIAGDKLLTLFALDILERHPGATILTEVKASQAFFEAVSKAGGQPVMWKTGHSLIKAKMKETGALLAGEMSGHIFFAEDYFGFDDAIYSGLRLIRWAENPKNNLATFLTTLPRYISTPEIRIDCSDQKKFDLVARAITYFSEKYEVNTIDGARVLAPGIGWALIRASNTQPALVLRFEASTPAGLEQLQTEMNAFLEPRLGAE